MSTRTITVIALAILLTGCSKDLSIKTSQGDLILTPLADNAVRVRMKDKPTHDVEELVFTEKYATPDFKVVKDGGNITLKLERLTVKYDKATETLSYFDGDGKPLMQEKPGSRVLKEATIDGSPIPATSTNGDHLPQPPAISGEPTYFASQSFIMQDDDHLFGTGQFQDGYLDIMGLTRRLTQNNTQIVSPMVISSKGYGILWHVRKTN